jgi:hypothetical protein
MFSPVKSSTKIVQEVASANFRQKLGSMAKIKEELERLGKLLEHKEDLPNAWDYLLPNWLGDFKGPFKGRCVQVFGGGVHTSRAQRPCKLVIFVGDLDRCPPEKAVEVLESLVLLTEGTHFVIFLAIDPRIVVTAIESVNELQFFYGGWCERL